MLSGNSCFEFLRSFWNIQHIRMDSFPILLRVHRMLVSKIVDWLNPTLLGHFPLFFSLHFHRSFNDLISGWVSADTKRAQSQDFSSSAHNCPSDKLYQDIRAQVMFAKYSIWQICHFDTLGYVLLTYIPRFGSDRPDRAWALAASIIRMKSLRGERRKKKGSLGNPRLHTLLPDLATRYYVFPKYRVFKNTVKL